MTKDIQIRECHQDAIYLTSDDGETVCWRCIKVEENKVFLQRLKADSLRTIPLTELEVKLDSQLDSSKVVKSHQGNIRNSLWYGTIIQQVKGYEELELIYAPVCTNRNCQKHDQPQPNRKLCCKCNRKLIEKLTRNIVDEVIFDDPLETQMQTPILRIEINPKLAKSIQIYAEKLKEQLLSEYGEKEYIPQSLVNLFDVSPIHLSLHSLTHLVTKSIPLLFLASDKDVSSIVSDRPEAKGDTSNPIVAYIYDTDPEGNGTTEALFNDWDKCLQKAYELASECDCGNAGCPRCLTQFGCPENNEALHKPLGIWLLQQFLC